MVEIEDVLGFLLELYSDEWVFSMTSPRNMGVTLCESYTLHIYIYIFACIGDTYIYIFVCFYRYVDINNMIYKAA